MLWTTVGGLWAWIGLTTSASALDLIGANHPIISEPAAGIGPATLAWNATEGEWLAVYATFDDGEAQVLVSRRFNASGAPIGPEAPIQTPNAFCPTDLGSRQYCATEPRVVWNATENQYMVAYVDYRPGFGSLWGEIFVQRLNATGETVGSRRMLTPTDDIGRSTVHPALAWNATDNEYLVVYNKPFDTGSIIDREIFGQRLRATGFPIGSEFQLSEIGEPTDSDARSERPEIAWNSVDNEYLVVFQNPHPRWSRADLRLFGQVVGADGATRGSVQEISNIPRDAARAFSTLFPDLVHDPQANRYLAVYAAINNGPNVGDFETEILGRVVGPDGVPVSPDDVRISFMGTDNLSIARPRQPKITAGPAGEWLVVWSSDDEGLAVVDGEYEIFGQVVDGSLSLIGPRQRISDVGPPQDPDVDAQNPVAAFNADTNQYLVLFQANATDVGDPGPFAQFAQRVGRSGGAGGQDGLDGLDGHSALVETTPIEPGETCPAGGLQITVGVDNGDGGGVADNGLLEPGEVTGTSVLCNGAPGADGSDGDDGDPGEDGADGRTALVEAKPRPPGDADCPEGGLELWFGLDEDGSGSLSPSEIVSIELVCNGARGEPGEEGEDGLTALVDLSPVEPGPICPAGGQSLRSGLDTNRNGVLDPDEVTASSVVCHGVDGTDGEDGLDAIVEAEDLGEGEGGCAGGGVRLNLGLDTNGDGVLGPDEVLSTAVVCHGEPGTDGVDGSHGLTSLVVVDDEVGEACPFGGARIRVGLDTNGDGVLQSSEVASSTVVCHGAPGADGADGDDGADGADGQDGVDGQDGRDGADGQDGRDGQDGADGQTTLVSTRALAAGSEACPTGGLVVDTGLDLNGDGVLDPDEVEQSQVICAPEAVEPTGCDITRRPGPAWATLALLTLLGVRRRQAGGRR